MMPHQIKIFETLIQSIDEVNGTMSFKGQLADETKELTISSLIAYIARDIFLAQKGEVLLRNPLEIKVMSGRWPHIAIVFNQKLSEKEIRVIETYLSKILWNYNFLSYNARRDKYEQRFTYSFLSKRPEDFTPAVA